MPRTRPSLFPKYDPNAPTGGESATQYFITHLDQWGKRILLFAALVGALAAAGSSFGFQVLGPRQLAGQVKALEDSVASHSARLKDINTLLQSNIYVACETLRRVQPANSVFPQACSKEGYNTTPP